MGIQGHHETGPVDARPRAEVHAVVPDHPAQVQVEALAGAAAQRATGRRNGPRPSPVTGPARRDRRGRERGSRDAKDARPGATSGDAGSSPAAKNASIEPEASIIWRMKKKRHATSLPSLKRCLKQASRRAIAVGSSRRIASAGADPSASKAIADALLDLQDVAIGERGRDEPHDLPVRRALVGANELRAGPGPRTGGRTEGTARPGAAAALRPSRGHFTTRDDGHGGTRAQRSCEGRRRKAVKGRGENRRMSPGHTGCLRHLGRAHNIGRFDTGGSHEQGPRVPRRPVRRPRPPGEPRSRQGHVLRRPPPRHGEDRVQRPLPRRGPRRDPGHGAGTPTARSSSPSPAP